MATTKNFNANDIFVTVGLADQVAGLRVIEDFEGSNDAISIKLENKIANAIYPTLGDPHFSIDNARAGTITFKVYKLSTTATLFKTWANINASVVIIIKNLAQTADLYTMKKAMITQIEFGSYGKSGEDSPVESFEFSGKLIFA
jgi:hypothetical protein